MEKKDIEIMIDCLAGMLGACDGAIRPDGVGFSGAHSNFARSLYNQYQNRGSLSENQLNSLLAILKYYQNTQLAHVDLKGIHPFPEPSSSTPECLRPEEPKFTMVDIENLEWPEGKIVKTASGKSLVQSLPLPVGFWDLWKSSKEEIKALGISVSKYGGSWQLARWSPIEEKKKTTQRFSGEVTLKFSELLLDYQHRHVIDLIRSLKAFNACLDGSDTGTGKTYTACGLAKELGLFPIVLTPKSVRGGFEKIMRNHFNLDGFVSNYEQFRNGNTPFVSCQRDENKKRSWTWDVPSNAILIFDEAHRCKNHKTMAAEMMVSAKDQGVKILAMSATMGDNPTDMYAVGRAIELFEDVSGYFDWAREYNCRMGDYGGFIFDGDSSDMTRLHEEIYPHRGARMRISELGDAFPDGKIICEEFEFSEANKIAKLYREMDKEIKELEKSGFKVNQLTIQQKYRQKIELLKVNEFVEAAQDLIDSGRSVAVFFNFNESIEKFSAKMKTLSIVRGGQTAEERDKIMQEFQEDKSRIIVLNANAGGVGISLHDVRGKFPRVSLISPDWSAQTLKQVFGRIRRAGGKSKAIQKIIFAAETVESRVLHNVSQKIDRMDTLNDGDLSPSESLY